MLIYFSVQSTLKQSVCFYLYWAETCNPTVFVMFKIYLHSIFIFGRAKIANNLAVGFLELP
jgi:hypothetical protein